MRIEYYAALRDAMGVGHEDAAPGAEVRDVAALIAWLAARDARGAAALADADGVRAAVNDRLAPPATPIGPDDVVALFPPMTGG